MRRSLSVLVITLCVVSMLFAKGTGGTPMTATFLSTGAVGVHSDNLGQYFNGVGGVKSYIGSGGKDYDLVTYSTGRYLTITFDPNAPASQVWGANAKLPQSNSYHVDFYGVNFYGPYSTMAPGTTAQVHGVLQFHYLGNTYQLDYHTLEVVRDSSSGAYHISSIPGQWSPVPSNSNAMLSLVRKGGNANYGTVVLPIQFDIQ